MRRVVQMLGKIKWLSVVGAERRSYQNILNRLVVRMIADTIGIVEEEP